MVFGFSVRPLTAILRALALLIALSLVAACARPERQDRIDSEALALTLLDQRDYDAAIAYLQGVIARDPDYLPYRSLLANSHMGRAGLLLLPLANSILQRQSPPEELYWSPDCDLSAVATYSKLTVECGLSRVMRALPFGPDNPDILAAQAIYRTSFGDAGAVSEQINFVAGTVELTSALVRLRALLSPGLVERMKYGVNVDPTAFPYDITIHQAKHLLDEVNAALVRFNHSYNELSRFIGGLNGATIYSTGTHELKFTGSLRMSDLIRFGAQVLRDKSVELDRRLSEMATERLNRSPGLLLLLAAADQTDLSYDSDGAIVLGIHLAETLARTLDRTADARERNVTITLFELAWEEPTPIILEFFGAANASWDAESGDPLQAYYASRRADWLELKAIANDWDAFMKEGVSSETSFKMATRISTDAVPYQPELSLPGGPGVLDPAGVVAWLPQLIGYLEHELGVMSPGTAVSDPGGPVLTTQEATEALALIDRTNAWMSRCFHPVADWVTIE